MLFLKSNCGTKLPVSIYLAAERGRRVGLLNGLSSTSRPKHDTEWWPASRKLAWTLPRALGSPIASPKILVSSGSMLLRICFFALDIKRME